MILCGCGGSLPLSLILCASRRAEVPSVTLWTRLCSPFGASLAGTVAVAVA